MFTGVSCPTLRTLYSTYAVRRLRYDTTTLASRWVLVGLVSVVEMQAQLYRMRICSPLHYSLL
jgi:hypothetical protein